MHSKVQAKLIGHFSVFACVGTLSATIIVYIICVSCAHVLAHRKRHARSSQMQEKVHMMSFKAFTWASLHHRTTRVVFMSQSSTRSRMGSMSSNRDVSTSERHARYIVLRNYIIGAIVRFAGARLRLQWPAQERLSGPEPKKLPKLQSFSTNSLMFPRDSFLAEG